MKIIVLMMSSFFVFNGHSKAFHTIDEVVVILEKVYNESPSEAFLSSDGMIGVEVGAYSSSIISQDQIVAELERSLPIDSEVCNYQTKTSLSEGINFIEKKLSSRLARVFRFLRNNKYIAHVSTRLAKSPSAAEECQESQVKMVLTDGKLIWIDLF